jgi:hypothetical protein
MQAGIVTRWLTRIVIFAAVGIGSFWLTLWATAPTTTSSAPEDFRSDAERLASYDISSESQLIETAIWLGLSRGRQMDGNVDAISRINDREVAIRGWLADSGGDATPLKLLVFVAGKLAAATETKGERPDVTRALALDQGAEKNVSFQVSFNCSASQQLVVVGLGPGKQFFRFKSPPCP